MTDQLNMKAKALTKDCIIKLLDLIQKHEIILARSTNATNNKLKDEAWSKIAHDFATSTGDSRRPDQLRLKWENLKKQARKRSALIMQNNLKTGVGKAYIPPDEVLERVASMLGATSTGLSIEFCGDAERVEVDPPEPVEDVHPSLIIASGNVEVLGGDDGGSETHFQPKGFIYDPPNKCLKKRRKLTDEMQAAQRDKDLALANYFNTKSEKVGLENNKIELEQRKLELENRKLELENRKLEFENRKLELENIVLEIEIKQHSK